MPFIITKLLEEDTPGAIITTLIDAEANERQTIPSLSYPSHRLFPLERRGCPAHSPNLFLLQISTKQGNFLPSKKHVHFLSTWKV